MNVNPLVAREYLRVSADRSGRQRSVDEQHADNRRAADAHGFTFAEPYREARAVSASRHSDKTRDGFDQLLRDLRSGDFAADVLILWESSRGSRRAGEWVTLVDLCQDAGVSVFVTTHGRTYDPANPRDRRSLLEDAVDAEYESSKISARTSRAMAASAAAGRPHGVPSTGYRRAFDPRTGALINWEPDPDEAPIVVELYERLKAGESLRSIAQDLERRGVRNRRGKPYTAQQLRTTVQPAHIGRRVHRGELLPGTWEPLVSEDLYYAVRRIIDDPARKTTRHGRAVHEFSTIIRCDPCGAPMVVSARKDKRSVEPRYQCQRKGCVKVGKADVDEILRRAVFGYLGRSDVYEALTATRGDSAEVRRLDDDLARLRAELDECERTVPESVHEARTLAKLAERLTADIGGLEDRLRALTVPHALMAMIAPGADVAERWKAAPLPARRKVAEILLSPRYLGEVRVVRAPASGGKRVPAVERLRWVRES